MSQSIDLASLIRDVPDFPKPGIVFKDITPLLASPDGFAAAVADLAAPYRDAAITAVAGIESRGFIFGSAVARELGCGFIPVRKAGKLPFTTRRIEYALEYGTDTLEIHSDAASAGDRVIVVDDLLATGGTAAATNALLGDLGAEVVGIAFVIELEFLNGRSRLDGVPIHSLIRYA